VKRAPAGSDVLDRPTADPVTGCPSGYRLCGVSDCVSNSYGGGCLLSSLKVESPLNPVPANASTLSIDSTNRLTYLFGTDRSTPTSADPVIDIQISLGLPCIGNSPGAAAGINTLCTSSTDTHTGTGTHAIETSSKAEDQRYILFDSNDENTVVNENADAGTLTDIDPLLSGYDWSFSYRRQVTWNVTCPITRQDIVNKVPKVKAISVAQLILMLFTLASSIYNYYATCKIYKEAQDDDPNNDDRTNMSKKKVNIIIDILVIIPTLVAIVIAYQNRNFFQEMNNYACSDGTTNYTFQFLAGKIEAIAGLNIAKFILSFLYLVYRVYHLIKDKQAAANK